MATHQIPRNVKGEGRILMVFSVKALIYTAIGAGLGLLFYLPLKAVDLGKVGFAIILILGAIGYAIGTFKVPQTNAFAFTQKVGGENIDDIIKRAIKFKLRKNRIYVHEIKEETKDE